VRLGQQHSNETGTSRQLLTSEKIHRKRNGDKEAENAMTGEKRKKNKRCSTEKGPFPMASHGRATHNLGVMNFTIATCTSPKTWNRRVALTNGKFI
jgi:hypothetical protein